MFISVILFISPIVIFVKKVVYCMYCRLLSTHFQVDLNRICLYKTMYKDTTEVYCRCDYVYI